MIELTQMSRCAICGRSDMPLIKHHVNYKPEIKILVCRAGCHAKAVQLQERPRVSDDVHMMVSNLRLELMDKYKRKPMMVDITNIAIREGIDKVEDKLKGMLATE